MVTSTATPYILPWIACEYDGAYTATTSTGYSYRVSYEEISGWQFVDISMTGPDGEGEQASVENMRDAVQLCNEHYLAAIAGKNLKLYELYSA